MAALYGANSTLRNSVPPELIPQGEVGGEVKMAFDSITPSSALSASDTIEFMKLPKGARVIGGYLKSEAQGSSCTIDLGHDAGDNALETADPDSLGTVIAVSSAGVTLLSADNGAKFGKKFDDAVTITGTVAASGANASALIELCILYVVA